MLTRSTHLPYIVCIEVRDVNVLAENAKINFETVMNHLYSISPLILNGSQIHASLVIKIVKKEVF